MIWCRQYVNSLALVLFIGKLSPFVLGITENAEKRAEERMGEDERGRRKWR